MAAITLDLIRRRAEHNSGIVATLEARCSDWSTLRLAH